MKAEWDLATRKLVRKLTWCSGLRTWVALWKQAILAEVLLLATSSVVA